MFILDTNVLSELFKAEPDPGLAAWLEVTPPSRFFVTAVSKAESLTGLAIMPEGKRKQSLHLVLHTFFEERLLNPILPFGDRDAEFFAEIVSQRRRIGRPIGEFDAQIAAIARANNFAVVTRNVSDFAQCGISVINPWEAFSR